MKFARYFKALVVLGMISAGWQAQALDDDVDLQVEEAIGDSEAATHEAAETRERLRKQKEAEEQAKKDAKGQIAASRQREIKAKSEIAELDAKIHQSKNQMNFHLADKMKAEKEIENTNKKVEAARQKLVAAQAAETKAKEETKLIQDQVTQKKAELGEIQTQLALAKEKQMAAENELKTARKEQEQVDKQLAAENKSFEAKVRQTHEKTAALEKQRSDIKEKITRSEIEIRGIKKKADSLDEENKQSEIEMQEDKQRLQDASARLAEVKAKNEPVIEEMRKKKAENLAKKKNLDDQMSQTKLDLQKEGQSANEIAAATDNGMKVEMKGAGSSDTASSSRAEPSAKPAAKVPLTVKKAKKDCVVRKTASVSGVKVFQVKKGQSVKVKQDGEWYRVLNKSQHGYASRSCF